MTRFDFANKLNSRLYLLSETERLDIIDEYIGHIDQKMKSGQTESDAIKDFGDIDDLAKEILAAYHIDSSKLGGKTIDIYIRQVFDYFGRVTEKLLGFSTPQLARIFVEFVVVLILLNLLRYPVSLCADIFARLFSWLPYSVYHIIDRLLETAANVFCIFLSFVFIYQFINKRIIHSDIIPQPEEKPQAETAEKDSETEKIKTATGQKIHSVSEKIKEKRETAGRHFADTADKTSRGFAKAMGRTGDVMKKLAGSTGDFVINLSIIIIKITMFICLWLPSAALTIAGVVCTALAAIVYFSTGIGFMGVCVAGVGCCIVGGAFTLWLTQMLTGGRTENA